MKRKTLSILLTIIGIVIISYPLISRFISSYTGTNAVLSYEKNISNITENEKQEQLENAYKFNEELKTSVIDDTEKVGYINYLETLNTDKAMGFISIPKIKVYLNIYHGTDDSVLETGVGHLENTSLPVGGSGTHCVLTGHTGLVRQRLFDDINKLEIKDKFYIYVLDNKLTYEVDQIKVVLPEDESNLKIVEGKDYVTLVTCTPYGINSHRLLVRGHRIPNEEDNYINNNSVKKQKQDFHTDDVEYSEIKELKNKQNTFKTIIYIILILFCIIIMIIFIFFYKMKKTKKSKNDKDSFNAQSSADETKSK